MKRGILVVLSALVLMPGVQPQASAQRAAVIFIEMEHEDADEQALEEVLTVYVTATRLSKPYSRLYWLVNTDATNDGLLQTMQSALNDYAVVDAYLLGHGGMQYLWGHFDDRFTVDDILGMQGMDNIDRLRFVYIGSCHSWDLTDEFVETGAKSSVGSNLKMTNFPFYPNFLYCFATLGYPLDTAVRLSQIPLVEDFRIRGDRKIRLRSD